MADPVLDSVAEDLKTISENLVRAKSLISVAKEAGEDTSALERDVRELEIREKKWKRVLEARGYKFDKE